MHDENGSSPLPLALIESIGDPCLIVDPDARVLAANRAATTLYGTDPVGRAIDELCPGGVTGMPARLATMNGTAHSFTQRQLRADGTEFLGEITAKRYSSDGVDAFVLTIREREITCQDRVELQATLMEASADGMVAHTYDGELVYANRAALDQWGADSVEAVKALGPFGWVAPELKPMAESRAARIIAEKECRFEGRGRTKDGRTLHVEVHAKTIDTRIGPMIVSTARDVSERMQTEEMVRYLAYHDMLTGLANRVLLEQELGQAISAAERHGDHVGVVFIDLDDFKPVNDTYGHAIGDHVLREVANRIAGCVRECDTVARLGGDEFVVVLERLTLASDLPTAARKLAGAVEEPMVVSGNEVRVRCSMGLALLVPGDDAETLLTRADLAMYESRLNSVRGWDLFEEPATL